MVIILKRCTTDDSNGEELLNEKTCYFCSTMKGLKSIWLESDVENDVYRTDEEREKGLPERSCCMTCFNNPDNGMESSPLGSTDWYSTNYDWEQQSRQSVMYF